VASQGITIAKIAGLSGEIALKRLSTWSAARNTGDPNLWSAEQWPDHVRKEADDFAERLREYGFALPVCYFVEWADMWSMGDLFTHWLSPPNCPRPIQILANRFQIFGYGLPDGGRLGDYLAAAGPQQFAETDWFVAHLREAVSAWEVLVGRATLVVLRNVLSHAALDEEVTASLNTTAPWLS
jgi:hypothetical protein